MKDSTNENVDMLVLYDGVCGLCNTVVAWLVKHDTSGVLYYAPLGGTTSTEVLDHHPEVPDGLDSIIFVERLDGVERLFWRSRASFRICGHLSAPWCWVAKLSIFPACLTDVAYRLVARLRYRIWGKLDTCRIPTPSEAERFLP